MKKAPILEGSGPNSASERFVPQFGAAQFEHPRLAVTATVDGESFAIGWSEQIKHRSLGGSRRPTSNQRG